MTDRPIIFSAPMVRALLDGRKTQTRRVLRRARVFTTPEQPAFTLAGDDLIRALQNASRFRRLDGDGWFWESDAFPWQAPAERTGWMAHLGYAPGDRLWVREKHCFVMCPQCDEGYPFTSSRPCICGTREKVAYFEGQGPGVNVRWRPSIHMPRWASRLTLIVTDVRVQRVQEISEADIAAEGVRADLPKPVTRGLPTMAPITWNDGQDYTAAAAFRRLWDSINAKRGFGWDANPWVVALTFEIYHQNIDRMPGAAS